MGLRKKTFLYSIALAVIMIAFVIVYFVLMLPSLYVDYVMKSNLESVIDIQKGYMENKSYDKLEVKNPTAAYSLEVPNEGSEIYVAGKYFKAAIVIKNAKLQVILDDIRNRIGAEYADGLKDAGAGRDTGIDKDIGYGKTVEQAESAGDNDDDSNVLQESSGNYGDWDEEVFTEALNLWKDELKDVFAGQGLLAKDYPIEVRVEQVPDNEGETEAYHGDYYKVHMVSGDIFVCEAGVSDGNYSYTTYVAMGQTDDAFVVTVMPTMTPRMDEISPIVMGSLPMIAAVIFLMVLVSSGFFSGRIVNPIIRLAGYAESAGMARHFEEDGFDSDSKDEIGILGRNLHELYGKLRDNYEELERKNRILEEENERQEVFLRASSHQLKTPIAAALLLVEGMLNEVGKYKNVHEYLPEVKKQLLSMRGIVDDILCLNYHAENLQLEDVALEALAEELLRAYAVQTEDRQLHVTIQGSGSVSTDREILKKIVDNMFSNAVQYTPEGQRIAIEISDSGICITNYGVTIDEELLPNIFEPFVTSGGNRRGKGLGLYVAAYYGRLMGYGVEMENVRDGVRAGVKFC